MDGGQFLAQFHPGSGRHVLVVLGGRRALVLRKVSGVAIIGAFVGGMGCFWIGILGRLALGPLPVSLSALGWWALGSTVLGVMLGICFPKIVSVVCFPFSSLGGGS